jgi:hypothetical protein
MARNITLTLGAGLGADLGPNFNLTANVGSVTPSTATKTELTAGKSVSVDDAATQVTVTSTGTCTNGITQTIPCAGGTTTTTTTAAPTTTTTTTAAPTTTTTTTVAPASTVAIYITNSSLDVPIGGMTINGVAVTWISSVDFYVNTGDSGNFESSETGTQDVVISYGTHVAGQRITFTDSDNVVTCQTLNGSGGTFTITGAAITAGTTITVESVDGVCP